MDEIPNSIITEIYRQNKLNYMFCKRIMNKYLLNNSNSFTNFTVQLSSFNSIATGSFIFLTGLQDNCVMVDENVLPYTFKYKMNDLEIIDNNGIYLLVSIFAYYRPPVQNLQNDARHDARHAWRRFLVREVS